MTTATVTSTLSEAVAEAGGNLATALALADIFASDMDFSRDVQPGDAVRAVVEANGTVIPVLVLAVGPICERGTFVVLLADCGAIALAVDTIDRPQRLRRNVGDAGWFDGPGVSGLAEGGATAFRILTGPALVGPAQAALTAAMPALIGGA
mgnify:CR=1 FL=1